MLMKPFIVFEGRAYYECPSCHFGRWRSETPPQKCPYCTVEGSSMILSYPNGWVEVIGGLKHG